jgi:transcriptional regulator with XRE-family HTH domain
LAAPGASLFCFQEVVQVSLTVNRVRELRTAAGLTQEEVALRAGVPYSVVTRIDANPWIMPRIDVALNLARAFDISVDQLIGKVAAPA